MEMAGVICSLLGSVLTLILYWKGMVMIPKSVFYKMTSIVFSVFAVVYLFVSLVNILNVAYSDYLNCINELKYSATIDGTRGMICTYIRNGYEYEQPVSLPNNSEVYVNNYHNNQCSVFYNDGHGVEWYIDRVDVSNVSINEIERDYFYGVKKYSSKEYMFRIIRYSLNSIKNTNTPILQSIKYGRYLVGCYYLLY